MSTRLEREQMVERELLDRVTKKPEVREPPVGPPPRRPFVRWIEWASFALVLVAAVVAAAIILVEVFESDTEIAADVLVTDEAQSGLSIGPRHLDADFVIPERWTGTALEGTAEELAPAGPHSSVLYPNPELGTGDPKIEITGRLGPQTSVLYPNPEVGTARRMAELHGLTN